MDTTAGQQTNIKEIQELKSRIDPKKMPRHIAIIMDGNGRWARKKRLTRVAGHRAGIKSVRDIVEAGVDINLEVLTLYAFSVQNWKRPKMEVNTLMKLLVEYLKKELPEMMENNIRLMAIGNIETLPEKARNMLYLTMEETRKNSGMILDLALNYGGQSEICHAIRQIARECLEGKIIPEDINENIFKNHLYTRDLPDPDLLIRTSGEMRVSNFLLWQLAYSEFWITQTLWPDFRRGEFFQAIIDFQKRERRFGKVSGYPGRKR